MKKYLLIFLISAVSFVITCFLVPGLNYHGNLSILLKTAVIFGLLEVFVRPLLNILLLPLNFLTMGLMGAITGLIIIWLLSVVVPGFSLSVTNFTGLTLGQYHIPSYTLNIFLTAVVGAFIISVIGSVLYWLTR